MEYYRKVVVLKETETGFSISRTPVSGIFRLEAESGVCTASISVVNLISASGGEYFLFFADGKKTLFNLPLGKRPSSITQPLINIPDENKGISVGLFYIDRIPTLVAFGETKNAAANTTELKKLVATYLLREKTEKEKDEPPLPFPASVPNFPNAIPSPLAPPAAFPPVTPPELPDDDSEKDAYDDEVVATENYFERDEDFDKKMKIIERIDDELLRNQDVMRGYGEQEKKNQNGYGFSGTENEGYGEESQRYSARNPFYDKVKDKLENLFARFPEEDNLSRTVPESKWVKITYSGDKYYVVGIVKKGGKAKYVCYGVPAAYSANPPKELKGYCSFVPSSVFKLKGDGYWMMFQDATTGTCIKM